MNTNKRILAIGAMILISTGVIALSVTLKPKSPVKTPAASRVVKDAVYDTVLLKKFSTLLKTLDFNNNRFSYTGRFNVSDGQDSSNNVHDLSFLFCRNGKTFYSKVGNNEVVNDNGANIYIENDRKKIVISNKAFQLKSAITNLGQLIKQVRGEDYQLNTTVAGNIRKISLLNEHHITCKELSVTYDTLTSKLTTVQFRFTDFSDPLNKKKERKVEIDVSKIDANGRPSEHPGIKDIVKEVNGKVVLRSKYATYELITL